jgi:hypothetical protein
MVGILPMKLNILLMIEARLEKRLSRTKNENAVKDSCVYEVGGFGLSESHFPFYNTSGVN